MQADVRCEGEIEAGRGCGCGCGSVEIGRAEGADLGGGAFGGPEAAVRFAVGLGGRVTDEEGEEGEEVV